MKIVVLDGYTANPGDLSWDGLRAFGELEVYDDISFEDTLSRMRDADVVYTNKTPLDRDIISQCPKLKMIGVLATGYNGVDLQAARERNIPVCNVPAYSTPSVAQFVFALLLEVCHHVGHHNQAVQQGRWAQGPHFCFWDYPLIELAGKTLGIIGYGRIGQAVAGIARAFGMKVIAYNARKKDLPEMVSLPELLADSDVISLHCPLFPETEHLIGEEALSQMKDGVILINTARGPLIDELALRAALLSGKVYAAALDVVSQEPIPVDHPLLGLDNCLITPHIAWAPKESRQRLMDVAAENLRAFVEGSPIHVVNPPEG